MSKKPEILNDSEELFAAGGAWLEALYEQWLDSPNQVSAHWQAIFESGGADVNIVNHGEMLRKMASTARLNGSLNGSIYASSKTSMHTPCDSYPVEYPSRAIYLIHA
ncbi:MAG: hypothetical protein Q9M21_02560, partial [Mariprofundaceae bacterium]|nr:hypothetical protein [Mariprofundaceae bacterium]